MCMAGVTLHRVAISAGCPTGRLPLRITSRVYGGRLCRPHLTRCAFHTDSLYLPLERLLIRL
jgi:hypothetical protein